MKDGSLLACIVGICIIASCVFYRSVISPIDWHQPFVEQEKQCGTILMKSDVTRFNKSKVYPRYLFLMKFPNTEREFTVNEFTFLRHKEGETVCFDLIKDNSMFKAILLLITGLILFFFIIFSVLAIFIFVIGSFIAYCEHLNEKQTK